MKKKFFSLIHGAEAIHIAPQQKFLPANEFSTLLDSVELLKVVKEDAQAFKINEREEYEKLKSQAQKEGYEEGFKAWANAIAELEGEIKQVQGDIEKKLAPIALKAAKKIVGREIEHSDDTIVDIVSNSLKAVSQHRKITIYTNKKDLAILEANRPKLKEIFESLESLSLRERADIDTGGCVIETEGGIINARLENQWRILENAFHSLLKTQKSDKGSTHEEV